MGVTALESFRDQMDSEFDLRILGTDINTEALSIAQAGIYPSEAVSSLGDRPAAPYFRPMMLPEKRLSQAETVLTNLIEFRKVNLMQKDYPIATKFDVILSKRLVLLRSGAPAESA